MTEKVADVTNRPLTKEQVRVQKRAVALRKALLLFAKALSAHAKSEGVDWREGYFPLNLNIELTKSPLMITISAAGCRRMAESLHYGLMSAPYQGPMSEEGLL